MKPLVGKTTSDALARAREASAEGANPLAGWTPSVPRDTFRPEVGSEDLGVGALARRGGVPWGWTKLLFFWRS